MISASSIAFHRKQYKLQGFTVLLNSGSSTFVSQLAAMVASVREEELIDGDETSHSWKEIAINPPLTLQEVIAGSNLTAILGGEPTRMSQWLNIYETGEFIEAHVDASGDAQLMLPVEMPPPGGGGDIWMESPARIIPVAIGDVLIFAASRLRHGTTPVKSGRRISFNARLWH